MPKVRALTAEGRAKQMNEKLNSQIIDGARRKRIARGSGTSVQDVNRLLKNYAEMRKMMKRMMGPGGKDALRRGFFRR